MKLEIIRESEARQNAPTQKPAVSISPNLKRERILLDGEGNEIRNFKTKEIIKMNEDNKPQDQ